VKRLLLFTSAVVFVDTLFYAALTPLLPHYVHTLHISKTGAGVLAAAYPAGTFFGAVPSGIVAARAGVKPTVVAGMSTVAVCTIVFGIGNQAWELDAARFLQGFAGAFSWTGALAWLVAGSPVEKRGSLIGRAFATAVAGALFGPVLGGVASVLGIGWTFGAIGLASLGLAAAAALIPGQRRESPQGPDVLARALGDDRIQAAAWFVVLPALLFGALAVLAPLRLSHLGFGSVAIGAVFLCSAAVEGTNNVLVGHAIDRNGTRGSLLYGLAGSALVAALLPWPDDPYVLAVLVVCGGLAFGTFYTPGMTLLSHLSEERGVDQGYTFALVSLVWAPGQTLGAAGGGALAHATTDALTYLLLAAICAVTLIRLAVASRA
jgi:MFS family permease